MYERRARIRRLRFALAAFAGLVLVITGVLGGVATALGWDGVLSPGPAWDDRYTITSIDTTGTLNDDGSLSVVEDIEVEWHEPRRGLIRDIDRSSPAGEVTVRDIEVTSDTQPDVWYEVRVDDPAGHDSVHLGEEDDFRPLGVDHYRITYVLDGLLVEVDDTPTLRWDTFGDQWTTLIQQAAVTLALPEGDHELRCVVGSEGQAFACEGAGPVWSARQLRPGRGVTVEARLDADTGEASALPTVQLDPLDEFDTVAMRRLGSIAAFTGAAALPLLGTLGTPGTRRRREDAMQRIETTGATYAPPPGMRPLTAGLLVDGEASAAQDDQLFAAWLLDAQQRDLIDVQELGKGFRARSTGRGRPDSEKEAAAVRALAPDVGRWTTWDEKTPSSRATTFEKAWRALRAHHADEAGVPGFVAGRIGVIGFGLMLVALLTAWWLWGVTELGSLAIGVGVLGAWAASAFTDRTLRTAVARIDGTRLESWRRVEGLRRFVAEAHADQISGVADDPTVPITSPFLDLLPWVIAFGHGDRWAERFDAQIRAAAQHVGVFAPVHAGAVSQARSAAKPPSTSGGSGGVSSGVGSGGGGGGGGSR